MAATFGYARNYRCYLFGTERARCEIVEKEERFRALTYYIVDAHCYRIHAYRVVLVRKNGVFEFSTHAVRSRDKNGLFHALGHLEKAAERTQIAQHPVGVG